MLRYLRDHNKGKVSPFQYFYSAPCPLFVGPAKKSHMWNCPRRNFEHGTNAILFKQSGILWGRSNPAWNSLMFQPKNKHKAWHRTSFGFKLVAKHKHSIGIHWSRNSRADIIQVVLHSKWLNANNCWPHPFLSLASNNRARKKRNWPPVMQYIHQSTFLLALEFESPWCKKSEPESLFTTNQPPINH